MLCRYRSRAARPAAACMPAAAPPPQHHRNAALPQTRCSHVSLCQQRQLSAPQPPTLARHSNMRCACSVNHSSRRTVAAVTAIKRQRREGPTNASLRSACATAQRSDSAAANTRCANYWPAVLCLQRHPLQPLHLDPIEHARHARAVDALIGVEQRADGDAGLFHHLRRAVLHVEAPHCRTEHRNAWRDAVRLKRRHSAMSLQPASMHINLPELAQKAPVPSQSDASVRQLT